MSPRTRELFSLVLVGTIVGTAFASVYIARQDVVGTESLSYALFFLGLYVAAHVITRLTVPHADPYLLPMAGFLTGVGLTEIYRLDEDEAFRQGLWIIIGLVAFGATLVFLRRDYRRLESYKYLFGLGALVLLALPAMPLIGKTVNGARLWVELGPVRFQPGEFAKIFLIVFLA
ncbi:MAG: FtsW/RodA/SpoVE family cell cycle protein, partial [Actinomycetota bacterium]|nr:FtsW/RodA/SpoVE family cell cycle protein [Actinomycetota bacterium]